MGEGVYNGLTMNDRKIVFLVAMESMEGNISLACHATGISRQTYYNWYHDDEDFAAAVKMMLLQVTDELLDQAEWLVRFTVKRGDIKTARWVLTKLGRGRGFGNKVELTTSADAFKGNDWPDAAPSLDEWESAQTEPEAETEVARSPGDVVT